MHFVLGDSPCLSKSPCGLARSIGRVVTFRLRRRPNALSGALPARAVPLRPSAPRPIAGFRLVPASGRCSGIVSRLERGQPVYGNRLPADTRRLEASRVRPDDSATRAAVLRAPTCFVSAPGAAADEPTASRSGDSTRAQRVRFAQSESTRATLSGGPHYVKGENQSHRAPVFGSLRDERRASGSAVELEEARDLRVSVAAHRNIAPRALPHAKPVTLGGDLVEDRPALRAVRAQRARHLARVLRAATPAAPSVQRHAVRARPHVCASKRCRRSSLRAPA